MRVLFVSSEIAPLAKTGGLADVSTALPAAHYLSIYWDVREQGGPAAAPNRIQLVRENRRPKEQSGWQSAQNHRLKKPRADAVADELSA